MPSTLSQCRALLETLTPLSSDCGLLCHGQCCRSREGEETGMLLFPGEEAYYTNSAQGRMQSTPLGLLYICRGTCDRASRPLSCRLFPLLPVLRGDEIKVAMDARARGACPLCRAGVRGLQEAFVEAVRQCGQLLAADEKQRPFLEALTRQQDEWTALRRQLKGR